MAFDSETETQVSTVFPNKIRKYLDRVCSDVEMTRSQFVRKSVKENLKEYKEMKERDNQLTTV